MELLKTKREWTKWRNESGGQYQSNPFKPPIDYPCYAYTSCASFGYEELNEHYLYINELRQMVFEIEKAHRVDNLKPQEIPKVCTCQGFHQPRSCPEHGDRRDW